MVIGLFLGIAIGLALGPLLRSWLEWRQYVEARREADLADRAFRKMASDTEAGVAETGRTEAAVL